MSYVNKELLRVVRNAKNGDDGSKEEIIKSFMPLIMKKIKKVYIKNYDLDDLCQESYEFILRAIDKFNIEKSDNFLSYVKYALINNFNYLLRGKIRYKSEMSLNKENEDGCEIIEMLADNVDIENAYIKKEQNLKLIAAISKLSLDEQDLIRYIFFKEWKVNEYAEYKRTSCKDVYRKRAKIIKKLRELLK